jgi:hypothetical protein
VKTSTFASFSEALNRRFSDVGILWGITVKIPRFDALNSLLKARGRGAAGLHPHMRIAR